MSAVAGAEVPDVPARQAGFRYGAVFLLILSLVGVSIVAPAASWARALEVALAAAALMVVIGTSRARAPLRRKRAVLVGAAAVAMIAAVATEAFSLTLTFALFSVVLAAIPISLAGGLLRLTRAEGVTIQAVAGALTIYLLIGLVFASLITFVSHLQSTPFFAQPGAVTNGDEVYYSYTVLTTTGFGDYTARTPVGHALAVLEMLTGQLYLVTVIGLVVGNFVGRRSGSNPP
jgi:hypothetical protein